MRADPLRRFLMRIALSEGRLTKWRDLYDELTPQDVAILDAYHQLEPWGDMRDDLRHAVMTASIVASFSGHKMDIDKLAHYLGDVKESKVSANSTAAMMKQLFPKGK